MTVLHDETPERVLAIYAHPDDPEISAGGTLARWAAAGTQVWVLITTRGEKGSQDPDADLDALAQLRVEETARAAAMLGFADHFHLGYDDGDLVDDRPLRAQITEGRRTREVDRVGVDAFGAQSVDLLAAYSNLFRKQRVVCQPTTPRTALD